MERKLGKKPFVESPKDFKASKYFDLAALPTAPSKFGFGKMFPDGELNPAWGMYANGPDASVSKQFQGAGDCVFASAAHQTRVFNKDRGGVDVPFDGKAVLSDYSAVTGYVIGDDSTDQGTNIRDALNYRRKTGIVDSNGNRHKIAGFVSFDAKNWDHLMRGAYTFGAIEIGFSVPDTIWAQLDAGVPWDVVDPNAQIIGGHDVCVVGSMASGLRGTAITWGQRQEFTKNFFELYNDECWGIVTQEMIRPDGLGLHGFDWATFTADLAAL